MRAQQRRLEVLQQHLLALDSPGSNLALQQCRAPASRPEHKVATADAAVALIPDKAVVTVSPQQQKHDLSSNRLKCVVVVPC